MPSCGGGGKFCVVVVFIDSLGGYAEKKESKEIWVLQRDELRLR